MLYLPAGWEFELRGLARALSAATPGAWISHLTAAVLLGLWLPSWFRGCRELHLSKPKALPPVRREGVVGHTVLAFDDELMVWDGIRISTPARTWLDLARILPLEDLVAAGDQLVRQPRLELEGRSEPWATLPQLRDMLTRHPKLKGIVKARQALEHIRPGSDSAPETFMRLALTAAGLPEPELQLRMVPDDPLSPRPTSDTGGKGLQSSTTAATTSRANNSPATIAATKGSTRPAGATSNSTPTTWRTTSAVPSDGSA